MDRVMTPALRRTARVQSDVLGDGEEGRTAGGRPGSSVGTEILSASPRFYYYTYIWRATVTERELRIVKKLKCTQTTTHRRSKTKKVQTQTTDQKSVSY